VQAGWQFEQLQSNCAGKLSEFYSQRVSGRFEPRPGAGRELDFPSLDQIRQLPKTCDAEPRAVRGMIKHGDDLRWELGIARDPPNPNVRIN